MGTAAAQDAAGDVTDSAGVPAPGEPSAADLTAARLEGGGEVLTVEYSFSGGVPSEVESLVWSLQLLDDDGPVRLVTVEQAGGRLFTGVFDPATAEQVTLDEAAVLDGDRLRVRVPVDLLGDPGGALRWWVLTQRDGGYEDRLPDGGADAALPFPG